MKTLGELIRETRETLNLTLEQLSERSGVDVGTISALENRKSDRSKYAPQLMAALKLNYDQLMKLKDDPNFKGVQAMEKPAQYVVDPPYTPPPTWPFKTVSHDQWLDLPATWRSQAEAYINGLITANTLK